MSDAIQLLQAAKLKGNLVAWFIDCQRAEKAKLPTPEPFEKAGGLLTDIRPKLPTDKIVHSAVIPSNANQISGLSDVFKTAVTLNQISPVLAVSPQHEFEDAIPSSTESIFCKSGRHVFRNKAAKQKLLELHIEGETNPIIIFAGFQTMDCLQHAVADAARNNPHVRIIIAKEAVTPMIKGDPDSTAQMFNEFVKMQTNSNETRVYGLTNDEIAHALA